MDALGIGQAICELRNRKGWTQQLLGQKLNVSAKTVSKWESGHGFPEVTQFPVLADIFGVTIDYLMTGKRKGIAVAGTILLDLVKTIDEYPKPGMLATVKSVTRAVGGVVPNVAVDIAKIDRSVPISVLGRVGDDEYGYFLKNQMQRFGINTEQLIFGEAPTGITDVMSEPTGERTFFNLRGANADFSPEDINLSNLSCKILHMGYIMLLDAFDAYDSEYGTVMARFLSEVREKGIKTSIDVVSSTTADYAEMIIPALKYCDYCIINELECCAIWGIKPYSADGKLDIEILKKAMKRTAEVGIHEKLIVHARSIGICYDVKTESFTEAYSLNIPEELIKGNTGAGDAYCAGCLYGIYNGYSDEELLEFASGAAASSLFSENSVDGMRDRAEIKKIINKYKAKAEEL